MSSASDTALLIVDLQRAFFEAPKPLYESEKLIANIKHLIAEARAAHLPVIYVQHNLSGDLEWINTTPLHDFHPDIAPAAGDLVLQKWTMDAFDGTTLSDELAGRGIKKLIIAGCQTEYCINNSCRTAATLGYEVTLVQDGHSAFDTETQTAAEIVEQYSNALREVVTVQPAREIVLDAKIT
jgi:nicotinamidase-related amidase